MYSLSLSFFLSFSFLFIYFFFLSFLIISLIARILESLFFFSDNFFPFFS